MKSYDEMMAESERAQRVKWAAWCSIVPRVDALEILEVPDIAVYYELPLVMRLALSAQLHGAINYVLDEVLLGSGPLDVEAVPSAAIHRARNLLDRYRGMREFVAPPTPAPGSPPTAAVQQAIAAIRAELYVLPCGLCEWELRVQAGL